MRFLKPRAIWEKIVASGTKNISDMLPTISRDFEEAGIHYCFVGGMSLHPHNYVRETQDLDILVSKDSVEKIHSHLIGKGYMLRPGAKNNMRCTLTSPPIMIDILVEGQANDGFELPDPRKIRKKTFGMWYASLHGLIMLKLRSNRGRDHDDVRRLIEFNDLKPHDAASLPTDLQEKFIELCS